MMRLRTLAFLLLAGLIFIPAGQSSAQVKYVDEQGNTHYVQLDSMVPEQYRAKAKPIGRLPTVRAEGAQGGRPYTGLYGSYGGNSGPSRVDREDEANAQRMRSAAEQNLQQKREDKARQDEFNRCVGTKRTCF
ncbi:MAG TPA: hypothetical protein VGT00_08055 [Methylomirabilota bacterium]|jgi:hypothetical protein|nr:hypothetical protein [Methylomirabilota bacterium]